MLIRGTTPTHTFALPSDIDKTIIKEVEITYSQKDSVVLTKNTADCMLTDNVITVELSQEDTFKFDHNMWVDIQIRVLTHANKVMNSDIFKISVEKCLSNGVLK